jgi:cell division protein FtsB
MNVDVGIWSRLTRLLLFLFAITILLLIAQWYLPVIRQNERMRKEIVRIDAEIHKNEEAFRQAKASMDALRYDPKAVERLARETLGYARPGETVIRFEEPITNSPPRL